MTRHCEKIEMKQGTFYDPLMDHLLEDGCKYPFRQTQLNKNFDELFSEKERNIKEIVEKGLVDWESFKRMNLNIPSEFYEIDGYPFIEDFNPICSENESLLLRICFSKNPTRVFGRPDMFETSDGTLYQFAIKDRFLSSSECLISGKFGRCMSKQSSIVFEIREEFKTTTIYSPIISNYSWIFFGIIGSIISIVILFSVVSFIWYKHRKTEKLEEIEDGNENVNQCNSTPFNILPMHYELPFIDDSLVFDI